MHFPLIWELYDAASGAGGGNATTTCVSAVSLRDLSSYNLLLLRVQLALSVFRRCS